MIILEKPYVSQFMQRTVKENDYSILNNAALEDLNIDRTLNIKNEDKIIEELKKQTPGLVYCNSENAIEWIIKNLSFTDIPEKIELFKDKLKFRKAISKIFPDFYFQEVDIEEIEKLNPSDLKFPLVLKPSIGFLSFGVYMIYNVDEWMDVAKNIRKEIEKFKDIYPLQVVDTSKFIIEEMISGEEYALDAYYNNFGEPVILNIYKHPFSSGKDVSDRVYYTSKEIMKEYLPKFQNILEKIGECTQLKNFPVHIEMRVNGDVIVPIELNPMRFAGWCMTDMSYYAWGINPYESFFSQIKPDWESILNVQNDDIFYILFADVPMDINKKNIKYIDLKKFLSNLSNPFELREIDYKTNPLFVIVIGKTTEKNEIENILKMDFHDYIQVD